MLDTMTKKTTKKRVSGPSGGHVSPRKIISASQEQWDRWEIAAASDRRNLSDWMRARLDEAAEAAERKRRK